MMTGSVKVEDMTVRWNVSVSKVQLLCQNGKIKEASKFGNVWAIPKNIPKPTRTATIKPGRKSNNSKSLIQTWEIRL
jgi:hypothetical protein